MNYQTAWRWFKEGKMPVRTEQMPSRTIIVYPDEEIKAKENPDKK